MLVRALVQLRFRGRLPLVLLAGVVLATTASATRIEYDIVSSQEIGVPPFSGLFADDDDDDDIRILSDDLSGLLALSTDDSDLFLDGQELRVDEFSLTGTAKLCEGCMERAIAVELDPRFDSVLEVDDGVLEGKIKLMLTLGDTQKELTLFASGQTTDPDSNFATPEFVSLLLDLDADFDDFDDFDKKGRGRAGLKSRGRSGLKSHGRSGRDDDDDLDVFLQAQGPVVPEPGTFVLLGGGLLGLALAGRRGPRSG